MLEDRAASVAYLPGLRCLSAVLVTLALRDGTALSCTAHGIADVSLFASTRLGTPAMTMGVPSVRDPAFGFSESYTLKSLGSNTHATSQPRKHAGQRVSRSTPNPGKSLPSFPAGRDHCTGARHCDGVSWCVHVCVCADS